jgi:hypothetical protein
MTERWTDADRDRVRARLNEVMTRLPGVRVEDAHGHTGYLLRDKRLAWLLVDHHGDGRLALCIKAPRGEQEALVAADPVRYFVPAYVGASGWVGVNLATRRRRTGTRSPPSRSRHGACRPASAPWPTTTPRSRPSRPGRRRWPG